MKWLLDKYMMMEYTITIRQWFIYLNKSFKGTKHSSIVKDLEKTRDWQVIWLQSIRNHGCDSRWEQSYENLMKALTRKWKSLGDITSESHVGTLCTIFENTDLAWKYTSHTSLTEREKVLKILELLKIYRTKIELVQIVHNFINWLELDGLEGRPHLVQISHSITALRPSTYNFDVNIFLIKLYFPFTCCAGNFSIFQKEEETKAFKIRSYSK